MEHTSYHSVPSAGSRIAMPSVAWWYETTAAAVEDAAQFERSLLGSNRHGDVFLRQ